VAAFQAGKRLVRGASSRIMRDQWIEKLVCSNCRRTGLAGLSQTDELSWDTHVEVLPSGFKVVQLEFGIQFQCISCCVPVEP
jgi:hypothetical protein